jgi:GNAT superfamily N-acetyltransferase
MTADVTIRPALLAERTALEALQWRASLVWEEYREALLAHPDAIELPDAQIHYGRTVVAMLKDKIAGFAVVLPREDGDAELDGLFVEPDLWRHGIGRRLVREAEIMALRGGAQYLYVIGNPRAERFYLACSFVQTGAQETRFGPGLMMRKGLAAD